MLDQFWISAEYCISAGFMLAQFWINPGSVLVQYWIYAGSKRNDAGPMGDPYGEEDTEE